MFNVRPRLELKKADLSIQASSTHYCEPRVDDLPLEEYDSLEIAIFDKNGNWLNMDSDELQEFAELKELKEHYEDGSNPVGAYVPKDLVEDLKEYLDS